MRQGSWASWALGLLCLSGLALLPASGAQAAVGGGGNTTTTFTTSTTHHETDIRVDLPTIYSTRVLGYVYETGALGFADAVVYDVTRPVQPYDSEIINVLNPAAECVVANSAMVLPGRVASYSVSGPTLTSSSTTAQLADTLAGVNTSVSTSVAFGPTTILIGDDQSQSFFVAAGTQNFNTNTHSETFVNKNFQKTTASTWQITGHKFVSPLILDLSGSGGVQASDGVYLPHPEQFHFAHRVLFDFYGNGFPVAMEWVGAQDGLLCQPKADGSVDGTCLFGTSSGYQSGFEQLASLDQNMDYRITGKELAGLMVWQDKNGNGRADQGELKSVQELGITELSVKPTKMKSTFTMHGKTQAMFDWWPTVLQLKRVHLKPSV